YELHYQDKKHGSQQAFSDRYIFCKVDCIDHSLALAAASSLTIIPARVPFDVSLNTLLKIFPLADFGITFVNSTSLSHLCLTFLSLTYFINSFPNSSQGVNPDLGTT